jgi:hypothetical protein
VTTSFDISTLIVSPVKVTAPALGDFHVDVHHGDFHTWLAKGFDRKRWPDGGVLMRSILREQAKDASDAPLDADVVDGLDGDQLEEAAAAFLTATGMALRPRWIRRSGTGSRVRARRRREDDAYDMAAREGEDERARLHRIVLDRLEDHRLEAAEMKAMIYGPHFEETVSAIKRTEELFGGRYATHLSEYQRAADSIRSLADAAGISAGRNALDHLNAATKGMKAALGFDPRTLSEAQNAVQKFDPAGLLGLEKNLASAGLHGADAISRQLLGLTQTNQSALDAASRLLAEQSESIKAALGVVRGPELSDVMKATLGGLDTPRDYFEQLRRQFHVPNPAAGLAALAGVDASAAGLSTLRDAVGGVTALRPGYHLTAALGLSETAPRGVVADILRHYDEEPDPKAPVFATAVRASRVADAADNDNAEGEGATVESLQAQVRELQAQVRELQEEVLKERDPVRRWGLGENLLAACAIISMVGAIWGAAISTLGFIQDREARLAADTDRAEAARFEADIRRGMAAARQEVEERYRTRYIATDGPLRAEPGAQGRMIQYVYAGSMVLVKEQRDRWVLVEVFNYAHEHLVTGWLPVRRLREGGF